MHTYIHIHYTYIHMQERKGKRNREILMPGSPLQKGASPSGDILLTEPKGKVYAAKLKPTALTKAELVA